MVIMTPMTLAGALLGASLTTVVPEMGECVLGVRHSGREIMLMVNLLC
jgi:hypothetical protein